MSIPWNAIAEHTPAVPPSVRADRVIVRRFDPAFDSYAQLTPMLHRVRSRGSARWDSTARASTRARTSRAAARKRASATSPCGGRVIGTATLYATDPSSACSLYRREGVASVRQVAVDPDCQSRGIGALLLAFAEQPLRAIRCSHSIRRTPLRTCLRSTVHRVSTSST